MKLIPLSKTGKNKGKYFAQVDDEDYEHLNQWNWSLNKSRRATYAIRKHYIEGISTGDIKMHRVIMNTPDGMVTDHINHNGLDNRKTNLRNCTFYQNKLNVRSRGSSKYLGVSWHKVWKRWSSGIRRRDKKQLFLGIYYNEIDAAIAYNNAAKKYHGEFANLNVVEELVLIHLII